MAATLDLLTDGRLELGLGAGRFRPDYDRLGLPFATPGTRVDRLEEALVVLKQLLTGRACSFDGRHYRVEDIGGYRPR